MIREIGSEFWDAPIAEKKNGVFPSNTQWFISGRSALRGIIDSLQGSRTVAMPSWCCDSMIKPFVDAGLEICFYPVYFDDGIIQEVSFDCDVLLLIDYFGYTSETPDLTSYEGIVIRDLTHSIFSKEYDDADYYFGSLRKWAGIWTGGYAWGKEGEFLAVKDSDDLGYTELREQAMMLKQQYIEGGDLGDKSYRDLFEEAEEKLDRISIASADDRDIRVAEYLDVNIIRHRRRSNAETLRNAFGDWLILREMHDEDCPLFVPVIVPNGKRDKLRTRLISNEIYCPVHWPVGEYHKLDKKTRLIYESELSLVCDQRYSEEDMNRMISVIIDMAVV